MNLSIKTMKSMVIVVSVDRWSCEPVYIDHIRAKQ